MSILRPFETLIASIDDYDIEIIRDERNGQVFVNVRGRTIAKREPDGSWQITCPGTTQPWKDINEIFAN